MTYSKNIYQKDHELQERHTFQSKVDWTIVRPAAFTKAPATEKYHHGFFGNFPQAFTHLGLISAALSLDKQFKDQRNKEVSFDKR